MISGDRVFIASNSGAVYALDLATGEERWSYEAGAPFAASPAVGGGRLVIGTVDGLVIAFGTTGAGEQ